MNRSFFRVFQCSPGRGRGSKRCHFAANIYEKLGYEVVPDSKESRHDIIQAVTLGDARRVIEFCKGIRRQRQWTVMWFQSLGLCQDMTVK